MSQLLSGILLLAALCAPIAPAIAQDDATSSGSNQGAAQGAAGAAGQTAGGAQKNDKSKGGAGNKRTTINFEDQLIEGQAQKPELFYLLQQRNNDFKRLIRLRENFLPEMRKSSEDIGRPGGKANGN